MKRYLSALKLIVPALLPTAAFAASAIAYITVVDIEEPKPGARPDKTGMAAYYDNYKKENASIYISEVEWDGRFDANGCFIAGEDYKLTVTASIKGSFDNYFGTGMKNMAGKVNGKTIINGRPARVVSVAPKAVTLSYTYTNIGRQTPPARPAQARPKTPAASPKPASGTRQAIPIRTTAPKTATRDYVDEYGVNHGKGIEIDGVVWAPVNCGYHKTKYPYGKLYQWGRKQGQGYGEPYYQGRKETAALADPVPAVEPVPAPAPSVAAGQSPDNAGKFYYKGKFDWYDPDIYRWNTGGNPSEPVKAAANDPCPKGWRVPTLQELQWLAAHHSEWTENEAGQAGMWFSGPEPARSAQAKIFLPAAGQRYWSDGGALGRGMIGNYWSSTHGGTLYGPHGLRFDKDGATAGDGTHNADYAAYGFSVRCVQE